MDADRVAGSYQAGVCRITLSYLEMIQAIVARMASHSFLVKGWTVTVTAALMALSASTSCAWPMAVAGPTIVIFWWLDAYYLRQERLFRCLFDHVRRCWPDNDCRVGDFDLSTDVIAPRVGSILTVARAQTLVGFYLAMLLGVAIVAGFVVVV